jgi:hypothetical protein
MIYDCIFLGMFLIFWSVLSWRGDSVVAMSQASRNTAFKTAQEHQSQIDMGHIVLT